MNVYIGRRKAYRSMRISAVIIYFVQCACIHNSFCMSKALSEFVYAQCDLQNALVSYHIYHYFRYFVLVSGLRQIRLLFSSTPITKDFFSDILGEKSG